MNNIIDAVAALFVYRDKLFVIKRQNHLRAFPGYHAFPGGKIDSDESCKPFEHPLLADHEPRVMRALCREINEELKFDIEDSVLNNKISDISQIAVTTAPPYLAHRFRIYYFKIELKEFPNFIPTSGEIYTSLWSSPSNILDEFDKGHLLMVPATQNLIRALDEDINKTVVENVGLSFNGELEVPCIEFIKDFFQVLPLSNTLPPADRTNVLIFGDRGNKRFLVDPSARDSKELDKLLTTISRFQISDILITHYHIDHTEFIDEIVKRLQLPIYMSQYSLNKLQERHGENFLANHEVIILHEGDVLTTWLEKDVIAYEMPGHCEGHIALAPVGMEWFFAGDLFHGLGAVVVDDMVKYIKSLNRIIKMNPKYILPSHGIALGGTYVLEKILEHRLMREKQIYDLYIKGNSVDKILDTVYFDIEQELIPYARKNIHAHLDKLKQEKRI